MSAGPGSLTVLPRVMAVPSATGAIPKSGDEEKLGG